MKNNANESNSSLHSIDSLRDTSSEITFDKNSANSGYSTSSSSLVTSGSTVSVLQPIPISEARNRSFLVGNIGPNDSLLGREELSRYFPNGKIRIFIITWNMSSKNASKDLNDLLLPESITFIPDLYAIGIQEGPSGDINKFQIQMQATIGASHVLLHSNTLGVLHLSIFLRRDLIWFCTIPEDAVYNSRPTATNLVKTKGAQGISFALFGTSLLFINCHLTAHQNRSKDRIEDYEKICQSLNLPKNLRPLNARYESPDLTQRFDCVFWFGDLNFRLDIDIKEVMKIINKPKDITKVSLNYFKQCDQLNDIMKKGLAFKGFSESSSPNFPPTYKFKFGSDDYDLISQRLPSFTDRILFRSKRESDVNPILYDWVPKMNTSDHKPVLALFEVQLKPGKDYVTRLNAGSFDRNVYFEALKKRVNEMETNYRNGSLVCTVM